MHQVAKAELVGSFLRPEKLKQARLDFEAGKITQAALTQVEDEAIRYIVEKQKAFGYKVVSDGEFRRSYWHLDFFWGFEGIEHVHMGEGYQFHGEETRDDSARVNAKIRFAAAHPFVQHFRFLKELAGEGFSARVSIPSAAQCYAELVRGVNADYAARVYPNHNDLIVDLCAAYKQAVEAFYAAGCRDLKLDDCTWGMLCDTEFWRTMAGEDFNTKSLEELYLQINNASLSGLPDDLHISTHVCRGNYHSTYAAQGGYEPVADSLFVKQEVETYFLEYDDERSGGFEPLRFLPKNKQVVLGLITSKRPGLESKEEIKAKIAEAAQYVPLERLSLSPQCGFASTEEGNILTEEEQWEKLQWVQEIAKEVWGEA